MKFTITEMSVGEILERAFKLLFTRLPIFFAIQFIIHAPVLIFQLALPDFALNQGAALIVLPLLIRRRVDCAAAFDSGPHRAGGDAPRDHPGVSRTTG